jgi:lysophospholipase L1-like esterase
MKCADLWESLRRARGGMYTKGRQNTGWITTWARTLEKAPEPTLVANRQTIRQRVMMSAGGTRLRVRFSNEWGSAPMKVGAASVRTAPQGDAVSLTFGGFPTTTIYPGAPMLSDPVDMPTAHLTELDISIYFPVPAATAAYHRAVDPDGKSQILPSLSVGYLSEGDQTISPGASEETRIEPTVISSVEVYSTNKPPVLVIFGDTRSANWPDLLVKESGGRFAVANQSGYAGSLTFGKPGETGLHQWSAGIARFDRDVLTVSGATHLLVFMGHNDISMPGMREKGFILVPAEQMRSSDEIITALRQIVDRARAHNLRVIGGTLQIYKGGTFESRVTPQKLDTRDVVNNWIRESGVFDKVIDFDAAVRDPADPNRLPPAGYDPENYKHAPTEAGVELMAKAAMEVLADELMG